MKTEYEIYMDYQQALAQARKLEDAGRQLGKTAASGLGACISSLQKSWRGPGAGQYLRQLRRMQDRMSRRSLELQREAAAVRRTARNLYNAERRSLEIARARTYGEG